MGGARPFPKSHGNYESWGSSFSKQAILQACASVHVDGTVILGRGLPLSWPSDGSVIEWANVNINVGRQAPQRVVMKGRG